jgi:hypothetical protein
MSAEPTDHDVPYRAPRLRKMSEALSTGAVTGLNLGDLGTAEVLAIDVVNIDPDYQREIRHELVNRIGRDYDIVKAGPILVSERSDGSLWCIDGQHRMMGAAQAGETEIFAHVVHGLSQQEEAALRLARNDRKSDTAQEKFRTRLVMNDPVAHAILHIVREAGTDVNMVANAHHGINAIATLEVLYTLDHTGQWLERVLDVISEAFTHEDEDGTIVPELNGDTCSTSMLKAICWFLGQHVDQRECTRAEFVSRLTQFGVDDIRRKAISHQAANGGSLWVNFYRGLVELYNWRRTDAKKLKWKTIGSLAQLGDAGTKKREWTDEVRDKMPQKRT